MRNNTQEQCARRRGLERKHNAAKIVSNSICAKEQNASCLQRGKKHQNKK